MILKFYKKLYLDEDIENEDEIIEKIKDNINIFNLYLICTSKNSVSTHIFEIFSLTEAFKDRYKNKEYIVVGMAYGKNKAFLILKDIFQDNIKNIDYIKHKFIKNK